MVHIVDHPLAQAKLTRLRRIDTTTPAFRHTLRELATFLAIEVTRDLPITHTPVTTPVAPMMAPVLAAPIPCLVSILRAGEGLLEGFLDVLDDAPVAHIGAYRDHATLEAVEYYFKAPSDIAQRGAIVIDPMLATGNTAVAAVARLKKAGVHNIRFASVLAAPEGVRALAATHPDVEIWTISLDERLNENGYIVPGLGDAGDRAFGTL